jgi:excisionase family DNA binding protein
MSTTAAELVVTLTTSQLSQLIRKEVRDALAENAQQTQQPLASMTAQEAAAYLKIPDFMLRKRARRGEIRCYFIGTEMRFDLVDLEAFKEAHRTAPPKKKAG